MSPTLDSNGNYLANPGTALYPGGGVAIPEIVSGNPNGSIKAPKGTIGIDPSGPTLYINTDGATTWVLFSGGGGSGVLETAGDPTGVLTATGPALAVDKTTNAMWYKPSGSVGNTGWVVIISPP